MDDKNLRAYMAELIGTFAFVFLSAAAVCVNYLGIVPPAPITVAIVTGLVTGLIYAVALAVTVPIGGGYLNPAVTITLWVFRRLDGGKAVGLIGAQLLGSVVAGTALYFLVAIRDDVALASHVGAPVVTDALKYSSLSMLKGIGLEFLLTAIVVFVIFATIVDSRVSQAAGGWVGRLSFVWIGLVLAAATVVGFPFTGAALNPARWLGPALWDLLRAGGSFQYHAFYWVGPIAGALVAGWAYTALILPPEEGERLIQPGPRSSSIGAAVAGSGLARSRK
jgi:MIP family channel proteins